MWMMNSFSSWANQSIKGPKFSRAVLLTLPAILAFEEECIDGPFKQLFFPPFFANFPYTNQIILDDSPKCSKSLRLGSLTRQLSNAGRLHF